MKCCQIRDKQERDSVDQAELIKLERERGEGEEGREKQEVC